MELQPVTGPLFIRQGVPQEGTAVPGVLALSAPSKAARSRSHDTLFVHLTLSGPPDDWASLAEDLLDKFSQCFFRSSGSVTAALRKAIIELNQLLLRLNLSHADSLEGAISSAVLRGQELFTAQVGESFALLGHSFGVERLPPTPPTRLTPLGRTAGVDIRYFHHWLEAGDMLLIADPRLAHLPAQTLGPVLVGVEIEGALEKVTALVSNETARLLLVEFAEEPPLELPDYVTTGGQSGSARNSSTGERLGPPTRPPRRTSEAAIPPRKFSPEFNINVERTARKATAQAALGLSRLTGGVADVIGQLRPPEQEPTEEPGPSWALAGAIAILIPIVVAAIFAGVYFQRGQVNQFSEVRQQMNQSLGLGDQAGNDADAIAQYQQVLTLAATAEAIRPGDPAVQQLRLEAISRLDRFEGVTRLSITPLHTYPDGTMITSIALGDELNGNIYTLDTTNNIVYLHETDDNYTPIPDLEPQPVLQGGQAIGNHVVNRMLDLMWRRRGSEVSRDGLAVLDERGALLSYYTDFNETRAVPLGLASDWWVGPTDITTFSERLYVLDPGAGQIWRYLPEGEGFITDESQGAITFLDNADLGQVVDVAIHSEDGSVILLYGDGRLRRYVNGRLLWGENELAQNGLNTPLVAPVALKIAGSGLNSSLFVSDPGSGRIIQFSLGGTFLAQFKATDEMGQELFGQIDDFAVAEVPLRLFVARDNVLYVARQE